MTHKTRFSGNATLGLLSSVGKASTILTDMPNDKAFGENAEVIIGMESNAMQAMGELFVALYLYAFADGDIDTDVARAELALKYKDGTYAPESQERGLGLFDAMVAVTREILRLGEVGTKVPIGKAIEMIYAAHSSFVTSHREVKVVKADGSMEEMENVIPFNRTTH